MSNFEQQRKQTQIRYPMAYRRPYQVAHISQAEKGKRYLCLGCDEEMIPRQGKIKRHHFAHGALAERCDPDNALHETAKAAIRQGFLLAQERGADYPVEFPCETCGHTTWTNAAVEGASIAAERSVVHRTKSDLVITKEDGASPRIIIEIVVTHDLEEETAQRYRDSGVPVIKLRPTWETVDTLREQATGQEAFNTTRDMCQSCRMFPEPITAKRSSLWCRFDEITLDRNSLYCTLPRREGIEHLAVDDIAKVEYSEDRGVHLLVITPKRGRPFDLGNYERNALREIYKAMERAISARDTRT